MSFRSIFKSSNKISQVKIMKSMENTCLQSTIQITPQWKIKEKR